MRIVPAASNGNPGSSGTPVGAVSYRHGPAGLQAVAVVTVARESGGHPVTQVCLDGDDVRAFDGSVLVGGTLTAATAARPATAGELASLRSLLERELARFPNDRSPDRAEQRTAVANALAIVVRAERAAGAIPPVAAAPTTGDATPRPLKTAGVAAGLVAFPDRRPGR